MVLVNILDFIIKRFSFKKLTYITSLSTSLQLLYLSKALRPFKLIPKDVKTTVLRRLQNTTKLISVSSHRTPTLLASTPPTSTNFSNNNFYSFKHCLASTYWVMIGSLFNENSAELLPLKDWRFESLLNPTGDRPEKLIIKKRYRSWSRKKSPINFDRRRRLPFRKTVKTSTTYTNIKQPFSAYRHRFINNKRSKLRAKRKSLMRWTVVRPLQRNSRGYRMGSRHKSVMRKLQRMLVSVARLKRLHASRIRRLKKVGYRSNKLRARFVSNRLRRKRSNGKLRLRAYLPSPFSTHKRTVKSRTTSPCNALLKARSARRPLNNRLHRPSGRPYVRFRLTPITKLRRFRGRGRRYRNLFQKNFSARSSSLIKSGLIVRTVRWVGRMQYKTRHFRLPPTDFTSSLPKKNGRWKHSYPYMFTNNITTNKRLGRSSVQNLITQALTPTRRKRQKRVKLNTYKRFARLKTPRWVLSKSHNRTRAKHLATKTSLVGGAVPARGLARDGLSRWAGALCINTSQLYITGRFRKHPITYRTSMITYRATRATSIAQRCLSVGRRQVRPIYRRTIFPNKIQNLKLRLNWLRRPTKLVQHRSGSYTPVQNLPTLYRPRILREQYYTPSLYKIKAIGNNYLRVFRTAVPTFCVLPPTQTSLSQHPLTTPRHVTTSPLLQTRTNINFVLKPYIQFFNRLVLRNPIRPYTYKYMFKKKLYSFLYPNQVRNALLSRKKKITFYKLVYKTKLITRSRPFYWPRNLKKHFNLDACTRGLNQTGSIFGPTVPSSPIKPLGNFKNQLYDVTNEHHFSLRGGDSSFKTSEVRIPRIRFKPGYQRLWRQARTALQESLKLRFIYQKKLSRYILRFFKQTNSYTFSRSEMSLEKTLMYSRLLPDLPTVNVFVQQNLVYLNGLPATTTKTSVFQNDLLQLIVSKWYYLAYRWIANWTLKRHKKFKRLVYRKGLAGKHRVMKLRKQKSYYTPHWIYLARYDISDIKPYLEVDYLTLSVCVVYNPYLLYYYSPDDTPDLRSTIYRLYNWKYIT